MKQQKILAHINPCKSKPNSEKDKKFQFDASMTSFDLKKNSKRKDLQNSQKSELQVQQKDFDRLNLIHKNLILENIEEQQNDVLTQASSNVNTQVFKTDQNQKNKIMKTIIEEGDEDTSTISGQSSNNLGKKRVYQQISQNENLSHGISFNTSANTKRIKSELNKSQVNNSVQNKIIQQISSKTQNLIKEILKNQSNKKKAPEEKLQNSVIEPESQSKNQINEQIKISNMIQQNSTISSLKQQNLQSNNQILQLPIKYQKLADLSSNIDNVINFLNIRSKHLIQNELIFYPIEEVAKSVKQLNAKTLNLNLFRQILWLAPQFYTYRWNKKPNSSEYQFEIAMVDHNCSDSQTGLNRINIQTQNQRSSLIKEKILQFTIKVHSEFLQGLKRNGEIINSQYDEPQKTLKWHTKFDIVSESLEDVPMAQIKSIPNHSIAHSSKSLTEFLKDTNFHQNTIQQAIQITNQKLNQKTDNEQPANESLKQLSSKYGISEQTLLLIKQKRDASKSVIARQNAQFESQKVQEHAKVFVQIYDSIQQKFQQANKNTFPLQDLANSVLEVMKQKGFQNILQSGFDQINDKSQNQVQSIKSLIKDLCELIPDVLQYKNIPVNGINKIFIKNIAKHDLNKQYIIQSIHDKLNEKNKKMNV